MSGKPAQHATQYSAVAATASNGPISLRLPQQVAKATEVAARLDRCRQVSRNLGQQTGLVASSGAPPCSTQAGCGASLNHQTGVCIAPRAHRQTAHPLPPCSKACTLPLASHSYTAPELLSSWEKWHNQESSAQ